MRKCGGSGGGNSGGNSSGGSNDGGAGLSPYPLHFLYEFYPRSHAAYGFDQLSQMGASKNRKSLFLSRIQKIKKHFSIHFLIMLRHSKQMR